MRILYAEDERDLNEIVTRALKSEGYGIDRCFDGRTAWEYLQAAEYDAVILDIMMPGLDGLTVLKRAREAGIKTPVMLLTAKSEISDRVAGLECGADDYLPKPFATAEFVARVRALTRRSESYTHSVITVGVTQLDSGRYELRCGDKSAALSNKEYQLMELFMRSPRRVFSTEHIMELIWGFDAEAETDVIWTYISFLRKKLRQIDSDAEIKTIRGAGYALDTRE